MTPSKPINFYLNVFRMFFRAMTGAYALNILVYLVAKFFIGEDWIIVAFLSTFIQLLILPTFVLLPLCLLIREWRLSAMLVPGILFFALIWGGLFLPNEPIVPQANEQSLQVFTYNMRSDVRDPQTFLSLIRQVNADIVALQEVGIPQAEAIEANLSDIYPYMALHPQFDSTQGQGILSRYPITEDFYWQYDFLPNKLGHQRVEISLSEMTSITIYNVHPTHPGMQGSAFNTSYRFRELQDILSRMENEEGYLLLLGDFNMPDLSPDYAAITAQYSDSFREAGQGLGWTFPALKPPLFAVLRIDYLFHNEGIRVRSAELWDDGGSDHHPILFELLLPY